MKSRKVVIAPEARDDLRSLHAFIAASAGSKTAAGYLKRIREFCEGLEFASERGTRRDHVRPGLRTVGFERRITVAFIVSDISVLVLRVFYRGADWEEHSFNEGPDE